MSETELLTTQLHALHVANGARMVEFAGYAMPLQYKAGIIAEHLHTRSKAGLFDVSHMGQIKLSGSLATPELARLIPNDIRTLPQNTQKYSVLLTENAGILDDFIIANLGDHFRLIVNASRKHIDFDYLRTQLSSSCQLEVIHDQTLVALQGPQAAAILETLLIGVSQLNFMTCGFFDFHGEACWVSRSGYTGEDGFEISIPNHLAADLVTTLTDNPDVAWVGLGARDTLRLEAGLCLYGHELDLETNLVEAGLTWLLPKSFKNAETNNANFLGAEVIFNDYKDGAERYRVGLLTEGKQPIRDGILLMNVAQFTIGKVTSGGFSPSLGKPIAMGYVARGYHEPGTELLAEVRGHILPVKVAPLPFIPHHYIHKKENKA